MKNGARGAAKKNGAAPTKSRKTGANSNGHPAPEVAAEVVAAPFVGIDAEPIDAPMWPIHSASWFQPEIAPSPPVWSGLQIERRHRIPTPGLLHFAVVPLGSPAVPDNGREALLRAVCPALPESGNEPLGWDPRALYPRKELA